MNQNRIWHAIFFKLIIFFIVVSLSYQVLAKTDIDDNSSKIFKVSGKSLQQLADSSQDSGTGNEPLGMMKFKRKRPLNLENSLSEVTSKSCKALIKERGDTYEISLTGKPVESYKKSEASSFSFEEFTGTQSLLITIEGYEFRSYKLIDCRSGDSINIKYVPNWSPSLERFLVVGWSIEDDADNVAQIWKVESGKYVKEWESKDGGTHAKWASENEFRFQALGENKEPIEEMNDCVLMNKSWTCKSKPINYTLLDE